MNSVGPYDILADTWWYGLTNRLTETDFVRLAELRASQGFTAVQVVAGIPPEIGPLNENAAGPAGFPWSLQGIINQHYLADAARRIAILNDLDLTAIVYGAWGYQIEWIGSERMAAWWEAVVNTLDGYDVIYCLTGEATLLPGQAGLLLPDKTMSDIFSDNIWLSHLRRFPRLVELLKQLVASAVIRKGVIEQRKKDWGAVLEQLVSMTDRPIVIHTNSGELSVDALDNSSLLSAITTQTGHSRVTRNDLWQLPIRCTGAWPDKPFINLEPWYEGISNDFYTADQLYAYWSSMLAGASGYCYGAHGIWNVGDGRFLAHWGTKTLEEAMALDTPRLIGLSHHELRKHITHGKTETIQRDEDLISISLVGHDMRITYYPEISRAGTALDGRIWLPLQGRYTDQFPRSGQVVLFTSK